MLRVRWDLQRMRPLGQRNQQLLGNQKHVIFLPQERYARINEISPVGLQTILC